MTLRSMSVQGDGAMSARHGLGGNLRVETHKCAHVRHHVGSSAW